MQVTQTTTAKKAPAQKPSPNRLVHLDHIIKKPDFSYRPVDAAHADSLAEDIAVNGLDIPLITFSESDTQQVKMKGSDSAIPATFLVAGLHRLEALKKIRREKADTFKKLFPNGEIPVLHRVMPTRDALFAMLRENVQRREMSPEEIFPVLEKLTNEPYNLKGKDIAKHIGKSPAWVSQHLAVNEELDEETKEEVMKGEIAVGDARELAADVRKERKSGNHVSKETIREKAGALKQKQANKAATGAQRASGEDRHISSKKINERVKALPNMPLGRKVIVLTDAIAYIAGEKSNLPPELRKDVKESKVEPKKPAAKK